MKIAKTIGRFELIIAGVALAATIAPFSADTSGQRATRPSTSTDLVQVAPHYTFYRSWKNCISGVAKTMQMNGRAPSEAITFAFQNCTEEQDDLKASLAEKVGLSRANSILSLVSSKLRSEQLGILQASIPATNKTIRRIGGWNWMRLSAGGCGAGLIYSGNSTADVIISNQDGDVNMIFITATSAFRSSSSVSNRNVVYWENKPVEQTTLKFNTTKSALGNALVLPMTKVLIDKFLSIDTIEIDSEVGTPSSVEEQHIFPLSDFKDVLEAIKSC